MILSQLGVFVIAVAAWPGRRHANVVAARRGWDTAGVGLRVGAVLAVPAAMVMYYGFCYGRLNSCRDTVDIWPVVIVACAIAVGLLVAGVAIRLQRTGER